MLLAIDTSTAHTGIACYAATGLLGECSWFSGRDHTVQLVPQIHMLLRHIGAGPTDVQALAVALGPGSWSGLRVGMSTAKGMALARDLPLIGVGTLDALVYQHYRPGMPVYPIIRLGRERFATAAFPAPPAPPYVTPARNVTLAEIVSEVAGRTLFCGEIDADTRAALVGALGSACVFPTPAASQRRPGFLAELAWLRWQAGDTDDRATLEPIYLGQPVKQAPAAP
ncbi:tRNA (adenosine(37)-N6)-threonylcarbamoyltransferase complex dimerization subunit type 1 TsaB [Chloroflexia bacterium SDU3-3]|nr:tRNA (adenosine(37)-N6)-threonylcarbamoyltransferase complex dimerization subunit type 1 TsaB [Chloroflexia bacterium SDU3-3]